MKGRSWPALANPVFLDLSEVITITRDVVLEKFDTVLKDPYGGIERWKGSYKGSIGYFLPHVPEEMIHAAGFLPVALLARDPGGTSFGGSPFIPNICCSYMRSVIEMVVSQEFAKLAGVITPIVCDASRVLSDMWRNESSFKFYEVFRIPRKVKGIGVREYFRGELERMRSFLENYTGEPLRDEDLKRSIEIYNKNKETLKKLYRFQVEHPSLLTTREFFNIVKCAMVMPKEVHTMWTAELLAVLEEEQERIPATEFIRLVAVGKLWEPPEVLDIIYDNRAIIAGDNFCVGSAYIESSGGVDGGDPYAVLMDGLFKQMTMFSGYLSPRRDKGAGILKLIEKTSARGAVFFQLKFCELLAYDYPDLRAALEKRNIPALAVETDLSAVSSGRVKTQLEAFLEIIKGS